MLPATLLYAVVVRRDTVDAVVRAVSCFALFEKPEMVGATEKYTATISGGFAQIFGRACFGAFFFATCFRF